MKLNVPYHSQFDEITIPEWKERGCAITCLKMCLDFVKPNEIPNIDDLIKEGIAINGYLGNVGWRHETLVRLAHNHGVPAYQEEFRSVKVDVANKTFSENIFEKDLIDIGVQRIRETIDRKIPVIVSVNERSGFHQLVVVGYEDSLGTTTGFYVSDPDNRVGEKQGVFMPVSDFLAVWRKFAIFVG
ncbi:MAG TPA: C39 family peptidase [Candidatus Paceibacterota bacterium]